VSLIPRGSFLQEMMEEKGGSWKVAIKWRWWCFVVHW